MLVSSSIIVLIDSGKKGSSNSSSKKEEEKVTCALPFEIGLGGKELRLDDLRRPVLVWRFD